MFLLFGSDKYAQSWRETVTILLTFVLAGKLFDPVKQLLIGFQKESYFDIGIQIETIFIFYYFHFCTTFFSLKTKFE